MKKMILIGVAAALFTVTSASAQKRDEVRSNDRFDTHSLTRGEKMKINRNDRQFNHSKHRAMRDGKVSRREMKKLHHLKKHNRHEAYRYKHNRRNRHDQRDQRDHRDHRTGRDRHNGKDSSNGNERSNGN